MRGPDYRRGYLRVPLAVWLGVFCQAPLTRRQLQLVAVVIRESWGWQRDRQPYLWTRPLPPSRFAELTGLSTDRISRDLRELVRRGVLREWEGCYHFHPEPAAWLPRASKARSGADAMAPASADPAAAPGGVNKRKRKQRDATFVPEPPGPAGYLNVAESARSGGPSREDRFVGMLLGFVGPLAPTRWGELRRWVARAGISAVWRRLEPGFRRGPATARLLLAAALDEERRRSSSGESGQQPDR